jgi:metallo-beta-lactamase class B
METSAVTEHRALNTLVAAALGVVTFVVPAVAQNNAEWTEAFPPFHIAGNLYYVGSKGLANYLITTPQGHILINSDLEDNLPLIRASVEKLGFKFGDIKILLISRAHWDHDAGSAMIKRLTGAKYMVMDADVPVVESGGKSDFQYGNSLASLYPATTVDRVLHDSDEVKLGGAMVAAHGNYFDMEAKYARMKDGTQSPFIDPDGYMKYVTEREQAFRKELTKQKASGPSH